MVSVDQIPKTAGSKARALLTLLKILANNDYQVQFQGENGPSSVRSWWYFWKHEGKEQASRV